VRTRLGPVLLALALVLGLPVAGRAAPAAQPRAATTTIKLKVVGCARCKVRAVQNVDGGLPYQSRMTRVRNRKVELVVPTASTQQMALLVYAPFDQVAQAGFPMIVMVGWKDKAPGEGVSAAYAAGVHKGSGCWAGTPAAVVRNKLVVTRVQVREPPLGNGRFTAAAGHLAKALPALPYFGRRRGSEMHVEDPAICR
jgi:hypothetical protein